MNDGWVGVNGAQFLPLTLLNDGIGQKSALTLACLSFPLGKATNIQVSKTEICQQNPTEKCLKKVVKVEPEKYFFNSWSSYEGWHWPKLWVDLEMFAPHGCDNPEQEVQ